MARVVYAPRMNRGRCRNRRLGHGLCAHWGRSIGRGEVGLDIVAALSMTAALVFGETLAAAVVAVNAAIGGFQEVRAQRTRPHRSAPGRHRPGPA